MRHLPLALCTGARLCRTRFGTTTFFIFDGKPCRAQPWRFCGIVFSRCILSSVRLRMRHKKSSYKSFKTIRSLCVILTVSIEIYELLILCAAKGVIFTFRKFFCVILFCTFCLFFALRFFPVFYCVFVGMLIVLFVKRRVKLPAVCRFALSFALPAAAVFCRALLPQRLFLPDVFAVQRHIRADGVFRRNKYLLCYTYLHSRARLSLDNRGVLW